MKILPLLAWAILACTWNGGEAVSAKLMQPASMKEAKLCLRRVSSLPKAEGYGALCTSIEALYQQQQHAASLVQRNRELEAQVKELEEHKMSRENEWKAAAKRFQG